MFVLNEMEKQEAVHAAEATLPEGALASAPSDDTVDASDEAFFVADQVAADRMLQSDVFLVELAQDIYTTAVGEQLRERAIDNERSLAVISLQAANAFCEAARDFLARDEEVGSGEKGKDAAPRSIK